VSLQLIKRWPRRDYESTHELGFPQARQVNGRERWGQALFNDKYSMRNTTKVISRYPHTQYGAWQVDLFSGRPAKVPVHHTLAVFSRRNQEAALCCLWSMKWQRRVKGRAAMRIDEGGGQRSDKMHVESKVLWQRRSYRHGVSSSWKKTTPPQRSKLALFTLLCNLEAGWCPVV